MPIDPVDQAREDAVRSDKKRDDKKADSKQKPDRAFSNQLNTKLKTREAKSSKDGSGKEDSKEDLFKRVVEVYAKKEQEGGQDKQREFAKKDFKKEDVKKEKRASDSKTSETKTKGVSEEGHRRVEARDEGRGSGGGGGAAPDEQKKNSSGFGSRNSSRDSQKGSAFAVAPVKAAGSAGSGPQSGFSHRKLSPQAIDEVVEAVRVGVNSEGNAEMEVAMSEDYFLGLKLKATRTPQGIVISFSCPTQEIKNTFLVHRPRIYSRLKEAGIIVHRIDIL